jgi:multicomponent Na+:H+ antiporter subunit B
MNSIILRTAMRLMMPLLVMFSIFLLLRGHNQSGGGFAGGLVAAAAFALYSLSYNSGTTRQVLPVQPNILIASGLLLAMLSGVVGLLVGMPFLTGTWGYVNIPLLGHIELGTPFFFDIGVYFLVAGVMLTMVFSLEEVE